MQPQRATGGGQRRAQAHVGRIVSAAVCLRSGRDGSARRSGRRFGPGRGALATAAEPPAQHPGRSPEYSLPLTAQDRSPL
jgi:hypothetical protein